MTIKRANLLLNISLCMGIAAILCSYVLYVRAADNIEASMANKEICLALGNELRDSSKELTRNARLYAASGDYKFEKAYYETLAERDGKIPRRFYRAYFPNEKHALLDLVKKYGASEKEMQYINKASDLSNNLVPLEIEAFNAVKGIFKDEKGNYTVHALPDRRRAISLLFGMRYDSYTEPIMRNMDNFAAALLARQNQVVAEAQQEERLCQLIFICSMALMIFLVLFSLFYSNKAIIGPLVETRNFSEALANGDFKQRMETGPDNEIGQLRSALNVLADQISSHMSHVRLEAANAKTQSEKAHKTLRGSAASAADADNDNG